MYKSAELRYNGLKEKAEGHQGDIKKLQASGLGLGVEAARIGGAAAQLNLAGPRVGLGYASLD